VEGETRTFEHLPFRVTFMTYKYELNVINLSRLQTVGAASRRDIFR
jgi:hypothetical protein